MNDPLNNLNIWKIFYRSSEVIKGSLWGHKGQISNNFKWQKEQCQLVHLGQTIEIISGAMVNLTPKVKVYGSKVKFWTRSYGHEIWHGWSLRHSKYDKNTFEVIQGHQWVIMVSLSVWFKILLLTWNFIWMIFKPILPLPRSYGHEIWHGWSLRHHNHVQNILEVIQGH